MNDLLVNPWVVGFVITIVGTVVAGLILYFGFGIGKTNDRQTKAENNTQIELKNSPTI
jgi:Mn2+/Fe2+ NRAMP family transporter